MLANGRHDLHLSANKSKMRRDTPITEPVPVERLNWLIHMQHVRGEINSCKELIKAEVKSNAPKNEYAYFKQGTILRQEGKVQEALDSFQVCLKLNPENVDNIKEVAKCLYEMRRFRLSLEAYLEAERIAKSRDWQIYYYIGQCYLKLGDSAKAKENAEKAVNLGKQETSYALLVKILLAEGDLKTAVDVTNAAVESCPDSVGMLTESGVLYLRTGQIQNAFERLSSALALDPTCSRALLGIGYITQRHEEYDVALTKYKIAVACDPDSVALWNNIGICFYSKQKYVAAISCLKRALWISPLNWRVLFNLGLVYLATQQPTSAFNFVCAAVNLRPDVADSFTVLGCSLIELQDTENAALAFRQAIALAPECGSVLVNGAACLAAAGHDDEAADLLLRYGALVDSGPDVPQQIRDLAERLFNHLKERRTDDVTKTESNVAEDASQLNDAERGNPENDVQEENVKRDLEDDEV